MSNLLCIYKREIPSVGILRNMFQELFVSTSVKCIFKMSKAVMRKDVDKADVLLLIRPQDVLSLKIAEKAKKVGCFVIFYMDDDIFLLPETLPSIPWRIKALKYSLDLSDIILSSSPRICAKYKRMTRENRSGILHTVVSEEELALVPEKEQGCKCVKLVYAAGSSHEELFMKYIFPILSILDKKYGRQISLSFVGIHPQMDLDEFSFEVNFYKGLPLMEYRKFMREKNFDIGLSPVKNDSFSKCKYFNKYIEYTLVGVTGVYSNCEPYTYVIKDGENGFLADETEEGWLNAICKAIDQEKVRNQCLENALYQLKSEFNDDKIRDELLKNVPELKKKSKKESRCSLLFFAHVLYHIFNLADIIYLGVFYMMRMGWSGVVQKVKGHILDNKINQKNSI